LAEDLESAVLAMHDVARSPQNALLLCVALDSDFDTPLWDFLGQILQPGILAHNRASRVAVLTANPAELKTIYILEYKWVSSAPVRNVRRERGFCHS
jgi:hypothetical protein